MSESIRTTPLQTNINTDLGLADSTARPKTAKPSSASLPKGGSQIENLKTLGSRANAGKTMLEAAKAPLTRDPPFREWMPPATAQIAPQDNEWSELDDVFKRQPAAGQARIGAPAHSLIDAPQAPLRKRVPSSGHQGSAARQEPARTGSSGMMSAFKRAAKNLLGLGRSSSAPKGDSVAETVEWTHEQNGRPAAWRNAVPKLSAEQARREGKPVPTRRAPPPPMTGSAGHAVRPATVAVEEDDPMELDIGSGMVSKPQVPEPAAQRDESGPAATPRQAGKRRAREGVDYELPNLPPLFTIPEGTHETGALASMGQHYDGLWRGLRGSINGANSALQSLRTTRRKGFAAKRTELESHAAELTRLIAETGMAEVDLATVENLKNQEKPKDPRDPESLRARAVLVDRDIHETIRQRNHARIALGTLQRAIASLSPSMGR